jgi:hypothetical protein
MSTTAGEALSSAETQKPAQPRDRSHLAPHQFGAGQDPREAQAKGAAAKRAKRDALAEGPREVIAQALYRKREALAIAVELAIDDAASANESTRKAGRRDLAMLLNQAFGVVERATGAVSTEDTPLAELPREERMAMIARLRADLDTEG